MTPRRKAGRHVKTPFPKTVSGDGTESFQADSRSGHCKYRKGDRLAVSTCSNAVSKAKACEQCRTDVEMFMIQTGCCINLLLMSQQTATWLKECMSSLSYNPGNQRSKV